MSISVITLITTYTYLYYKICVDSIIKDSITVVSWLLLWVNAFVFIGYVITSGFFKTEYVMF